MDFTLRLRDAGARRNTSAHRPVLLDPTTDEGQRELARLLESPHIVVIDEMAFMLEELTRTRRPREDLSREEVDADIASLLDGTPSERFGLWAYYPWSDRLIHVLPRAMHRELRLDRNRYKITTAEQARLLCLRLGIVGLSVGRSVASTLAREGLGGEVRLADFDTLSLSNLNRLEGSLADVGVNKTVLAARQIAELDPYVDVDVFPAGINAENVDAFLKDLDVLIEECDDLAMKVALRERARALGIPVLMATSDRGMLDIERFDLEPDREPFHGLLTGVHSSDLHRLSTKEKVPYLLRIIDAVGLDGRAAASLMEVKETLSTWPQLASDVVHGGAMITNAVRRMMLGELRCSGRFYADLDALICEGAERLPSEPAPLDVGPAILAPTPPALAWPEPGTADGPTTSELRFIVACATRAPSGGNAQPWRFEAKGRQLACFLDLSRSATLLDFERRGSYLAIGAALENAIVARDALGLDGAIDIEREIAARPGSPVWTLDLERARSRPMNHAARARVEHVHRRSSNRRSDPSGPVDAADVEVLCAIGAPLRVDVLRRREVLGELGGALGELDRLRFLSPRFRDELFGELRFTPDEARRTRDGIELAALELPRSDLALLGLLRSAKAMDFLRKNDLGGALGNAARSALPLSGAVLVLTGPGTDPASLVEAGRGLAKLWVEATTRDLAVHPWGTPYLFQRLLESPESLDRWERNALERALEVFRRHVPIPVGCPLLMLLRISKVGAATSRSLRREVGDVLSEASD